MRLRQGNASPTATDAAQPGFTDYYYNSNLVGAVSRYVTEAAHTITAGEGNDGTDRTDGRYNYKGLPQAWLNDQSKPPYRHLGKGSYLFADGHVKAYKPQDVMHTSPQQGPSFSLR